MTTKIVFMGTPNFSVPILNALIANDDYEVAAVMTQPDRPVGRKRVLTPTPLRCCNLKSSLVQMKWLKSLPCNRIC